MLRLLSILTLFGAAFSAAPLYAQTLSSAEVPPLMAQCESGNDAGACLELTNYWRNKGQTPRTLAEIARLDRLGCDAAARSTHSMASLWAGIMCLSTGNRYREGQGVEVDYAISTDAYRKACDAGNRPSCAYYGEALRDGRGVAKDERLALVAYRKACSDELPVACYQASRMLFFTAQSDKGDVQNNPDYRFGREAAQITCAAEWTGKGAGCWYLGVYQAYGWGGPASAPEALKSYRTACGLTGEADFCWFYAALLAKIEPPLRDLAEARRVFAKSCEDGFENACEDFERLNR